MLVPIDFDNFSVVDLFVAESYRRLPRGDSLTCNKLNLLGGYSYDNCRVSSWCYKLVNDTLLTRKQRKHLQRKFRKINKVLGGNTQTPRTASREDLLATHATLLNNTHYGRNGWTLNYG